ncbi:MAG: Na+/H+ antiporter [Ferruginibacter sp.]
MKHNFIFFLSLPFITVLLIILAKKIKVAYPILLIIAGLLISLIPGVPLINVDPELIFLIFLPPLLYEAAWAISWKELWKWRRIITSFAFVVVFFTAFSVAVTAYYLIPGFTLALGFLLGGIVSPPDAVSAAAVLKTVDAPKRMRSILEGESLLNDASSLIIFQFALVAITTGKFVWYQAAGSFLWMVIGGVAAGWVVGKVFMWIHNKLPTDPDIDIVITLVTPYVMYLVAEEIHSSGVLAVVTGGLLLSNNSHRFLSSSSRLKGVNVWQSLVFILNGLVFMIIGLDLPQIISELGEAKITTAIWYGVLITIVLVAVRIFASYMALFTTLVMRRFIKVADDRNPGWKTPIVLGWAGMRGVVSLAAALSIPALLDDGSVFPQRNMILFITFVVIFLTLVVQGLTLPLIIKKAQMPDYDFIKPEEEVDAELFSNMSKDALDYIQDKYGEEMDKHPALMNIVNKWEKKFEEMERICCNETTMDIYRDILEYQRNWLLQHNRQNQDISEEIIRKHLTRIDLEEERLLY